MFFLSKGLMMSLGIRIIYTKSVLQMSAECLGRISMYSSHSLCNMSFVLVHIVASVIFILLSPCIS